MGDIAFLLELGLIATGLTLLHFGRERSAALLRAAGWILVVGAAGTMLCTSYFWFRYHAAGDFDRAVAAVSSPVQPTSLDRVVLRTAGLAQPSREAE